MKRRTLKLADFNMSTTDSMARPVKKKLKDKTFHIGIFNKNVKMSVFSSSIIFCTFSWHRIHKLWLQSCLLITDSTLSGSAPEAERQNHKERSSFRVLLLISHMSSSERTSMSKFKNCVTNIHFSFFSGSILFALFEICLQPWQPKPTVAFWLAKRPPAPCCLLPLVNV